MPYDVTLKRLSHFVGNSTLVDDDPLYVQHRDVLYVPSGMHDATPGLFDRGRKMLGGADDFRALPHPKPLQPAYTTLDPERFEFVPDDVEYVFLGTLTGHYGHFITSSMARFWAVRFAPGTQTRYVVLNQPPLVEFFDVKFIAEILAAVGITQENIVSFDHPVRFKHITVPSPAFEEHNFSHRVFGKLCARIGDMMVPERLIENDTPVFLSKAILGQGVSRVVNEAELVGHLERAGVEIVHPETMNMASKVAMFRSRRLITGLAGSGMHTAVFAPNRDKLALTFSDYLLSNQSLIDKASGGTTETYIAESTVEPEMPDWHTSYRLHNPERVAAAFLSLVDHELAPRTERRRMRGSAPEERKVRRVGHFSFDLTGTDHLAAQSGWNEMEPVHCWTAGPVSTFALAVQPSQGSLSMSLWVDALLARPHLVSRPLTVFVNDVEVVKLSINRLTTYEFPLPARCIGGDVLRLRFVHPLTASPQHIGGAQDRREMSIMFKEIVVTETVSV